MSLAHRTPGLLWSIVLVMAAAAGLAMTRDRVYADFPALHDDLLYINSSALVTKVGLSYDAVLADVYWIRALQHYGDGRLHPNASHRFELLYPFLDMTTSLDPRFTVAYRFGAIFLAEPYPDGAGRPDQAVALLEKGVRAMPAKWEFFHDIGFVYYWHLHDYNRAAKWFERGAELPGGPWWLRTYAAVMLSRGGDRQASRFMWQNIQQSSGEGWLRRNAALRLAQLDALDQIDAIQRAAAEFERRRGKPADTWEQMVTAGVLGAIPMDPGGVPYQWDPSKREVTVARWSPLYPLPTEPLPGQPPALPR